MPGVLSLADEGDSCGVQVAEHRAAQKALVRWSLAEEVHSPGSLCQPLSQGCPIPRDLKNRIDSCLSGVFIAQPQGEGWVGPSLEIQFSLRG